MIDLGMKNHDRPLAIGDENKNKVYYPSLHINKMVDEFKDKKIGQICRLEVIAKIVSIAEDG